MNATHIIFTSIPFVKREFYIFLRKEENFAYVYAGVHIFMIFSIE